MDYRKMAEERLEERARIFEQRKALAESDKTDAEKREGFERMDADMDRLATEAREFVEEGEREAGVADLMTRAGALNGATRTPDRREDPQADAFAEGWRAVATGERREFAFDFSQGIVEGRALPANVIESVSDGAGDNQAGVAGTVTPDTFVAQLLDSMTDASDLLAKVRKISTSSGEVMNWPRRVSKVGNTFQHILEAGTYSSVNDGSFDLFPLASHKFGAIAEIPEEALTDPKLNIAAIVAEEMGEDLAESLAAEIYGGSTVSDNIKSTVPVLHDNTIPNFAGDATDVAVYDALIDMQHDLRQKYRRNATWTVSDDFARRLRKVKDAEGRYIWQAAVIAGQPDMLLGKPVSVEYLLPALGSTSGQSYQVALYGDLRRFYVVRNVRNVSVRRSTEYGFDRDTVALKITWRGDGGVTDTEALASGTVSIP